MTDDSNVRTGRSTNLLGEVRRQLVRVHAGADDARYASGTEGGEHDRRYAHPQISYPSGYDQHAAYEQSYVGNDPAGYKADPDVAGAGYDETYEEPVRERRRGSLITAAAVLGLAVVSTAGVLGYGAFTGSGSWTQPLSEADITPANIVSSPPSSDRQGRKIFYDGADKSPPATLREGQPVEMKDAAPRVMMTPAISAMRPQATPSQTPIANTAASAASGTVVSEPPKVKPVAIRTDGTSGAESSSTSPPTRAPATQPADALRAPMGARTQTASIPRPGAVTVSTPPVSRGYVVQLVPNKSEAEAQSSFKVLQSKYSTVLGKRTVVIRSVELGDRGTYYRAQIGPFANLDLANFVCDKLKFAGDECIVQEN